jgi:polyisoprenoid-binding protein YceI
VRVSKLRKRSNLAALVLPLLAACGAPPARLPDTHPAGSSPPARSAAARPAARGAPYHIDSSHSELRLLIYRAGVMAALGHDRALEGWVSFSGDLSGAAFYLKVPTSGFLVDEDAARRQEGADFAEEIDAQGKAGTLHNMLSPAVLDAQEHPSITVQSISIEPATAQAEGGAQATVRVSVAGHESSLVVPFAVDTSQSRLHALVDFTLLQTRIGLTPFSVFMGALRVEDQLRVKLDLVALRD